MDKNITTMYSIWYISKPGDKPTFILTTNKTEAEKKLQEHKQLNHECGIQKNTLHNFS
jgi:hypothetical protein